MAWYIGMMSGTSLDGIDGVLTDDADGRLRTLEFIHHPLAADLRAELLSLNVSGNDELHRSALASNALARGHAEVVRQLLQRGRVAPGQVRAIGAHGQTVRHRPGEFDGHGYTLQLLNGALLAELTGIAVVCDLRSRDVAAGGQGAPLVPAFHAAAFGAVGQERAVLNLGGIANLTLLHADGQVRGFDCGPGNVLMDLWCQRHRGVAFDAGGAWAAGGRLDKALLQRLLAEPFLQRPPPKSTGRDLFSDCWLDSRLDQDRVPPQDVMATLAEFSARCVAEALARHAPRSLELFVCGGGAANDHLMRRLAALLGPQAKVRSTAAAGVPPHHVETLAFAWLAHAHLEGLAGNMPAVTGAAGPRVLGALFPAR